MLPNRDYQSSLASTGFGRICIPAINTKGQALVLALVSLVVLVVGVLVVFNTGQTVSKKIQLVNAADAAAYSTAVQQARAFNMIAYLNRATVANQVAMAQMVSWYSWTNFAISATVHLKDAIQKVAIVADVSIVGAEIGAALQEVVSVLTNISGWLKEGRNIEQNVFRVAAKAIATMDGTYSKASRLFSTTSSADAVKVAQQIVKMNAPQARIPAQGLALLGLDATKASNYIQHYSIPNRGHDNKGANRLLNVVMEARDPFSRQRNGHLGLPSQTEPSSYPVGSAGLYLGKDGGSDLVGYHNWVGIDTLNLHVWYPVCFSRWGTPRTCHIYDPLAWGGGAIVDHKNGAFKDLAKRDQGWQGPYSGMEPAYAGKAYYPAYSGALGNGDAGKRVLNEPAEGGENKAWIVASSPFGNILGGTVGLPDYDDIKKDKSTVPYINGQSAHDIGIHKLDVGPAYTVLVEESTGDVRTSSHVDGIGGPPDFNVSDRTAHNKITAVGSAQVYFERSHVFPSLSDPRREIGNLFSPYWQARRIETPCIIRQTLAASYGTTAACD